MSISGLMDARLDVLKQYNEQHTYSPCTVTTETDVHYIRVEANAICFQNMGNLFRVSCLCRSFALRLVPAVVWCALACLTLIVLMWSIG